MKRRILCLLLALTMILTLTAAPVSAAGRRCVTVTAAPTREQNVTWSIRDGLLVISGHGRMEDYAPGEAPWLAEEVYAVIIEDGVTYLGSNAFRGMKKLQDVTIGAGVTAMGESVFADCPQLSRVLCTGDSLSVPTGSFTGCPMLATFWFLGDMPVLAQRSLSTGSGWIDVFHDFNNKTWSDRPGNVTTDGIGWYTYNVRPGERGSCGENVTWQIFYNEMLHADTDILVISGTGSMDDFADGEAPWLPYCDRVYTLVVANGVSRIGDGAFRGQHLSEIIVAGSVREIGAEAFRGVTNLWRLPITENIRYMGDYAFAGTSVGLLTGGGPLPEMGVGVYENCTRLTRAELQNGTAAIPDRTFFGCTSLEKITIPYSVTAIGQDAFAGCTNLDSVTYNGTTAQWNAIELGSGNEALLNAKLLGIIPTSGTCGENALWELNEETGTLTISGTGHVDQHPWSNAAAQIQTVVVVEGITALGDETLRDLDNATRIELPDTLTTLGKGAISNCDILESIVIPSAVTEIPDELFAYCRKLISVELHEGITAIGTGAFKMCSSLSLIEIPAGLTSLGGDAFLDCDNLTEFVWPKAVTHIGSALRSSGVRELVLPEGATAIGAYAFDGCHNLETIYIPDSVASIGQNAFTGTAKLRSVHIPKGITEIPMHCFSRSGIREAILPEGVTHIDDYAFTGCPELERVVLPDTLTAIDSDAFSNCSSLKQINWPSGVKNIGWHLFRGSGLVEFTVPATVELVESYAFMDCTSLEKLVFEGKDTELSGSQIFENTPVLTIWCWYGSDAQDQAEFEMIPYVLFDPPASPTMYPIYTTAIGAGTLTADPAESAGYEWITIEASPAPGNVLAALEIYYYSDRELDLRAEQLSDTTFRLLMPKCPVEIVALFLDERLTFVDVLPTDFYYDSVLWAVEKGITNGVDATHFGPGTACNRAQVVTFLWRAAGCPEPEQQENPFVDVVQGSFYEKAVLWAVEKGITNGTDATHFSPSTLCNRASVVTFLWRAAGQPAPSDSQIPFTDVPGDSWYTAPVLWAVENGITNGMGDGTFGSEVICNRAQVVTFLYRSFPEG